MDIFDQIKYNLNCQATSQDRRTVLAFISPSSASISLHQEFNNKSLFIIQQSLNINIRFIYV